MKKILIIIAALFLIQNIQAQTDSNHYDVQYRFFAYDTYQIQTRFNEHYKIDNITNDTIIGVFQNVQAGSFIRACIKVKRWINDETGITQFQGVQMFFKNVTVK